MENKQKSNKEFVPNFYKRKIETAESQAESLKRLVDVSERINLSLIRIGTQLQEIKDRGIWVTVRK